MNMSKYLKQIFLFSISILVGMVMWSCSQDGPNDSPFVKEDGPAESTILVYAVATNSLSANLVYDKREMVAAAENIDLERNNVLVFQAVYEYNDEYQPTGNGEATLLKLSRTQSGYGWETVKDFTYDKNPLNPERITEVIDYVVDKYPSDAYGMIFWSHSTASDPYFPTKAINNSNENEYSTQLPMVYSFGEDKVVGSGYADYQINVEDLADAVPDHLFNFIWFDSCYMSNIESIYQFRNKCNYYIGYATEVCNDGMPYQYTLPLLTGKDPRIVEAAKRLFDFYDKEYYYQLATIAVTDMKQIDLLKDYCKEVYEGNKQVPAVPGMHKYTNNRQSSGPFYDLGDYTKAVANLNGRNISANEWDEVLSQCVIYKAATPKDFNGREIDPERYSGVSTYVYHPGESTAAEQYYESLDWFKSVYNGDKIEKTNAVKN